MELSGNLPRRETQVLPFSGLLRQIWLVYCLSLSLLICNTAPQAALVVKNPCASAGDKRDLGLVPGLGRSPGGGHGKTFQYSCLENPMDRGVWWATIHKITNSRTHAHSMELMTSLSQDPC